MFQGMRDPIAQFRGRRRIDGLLGQVVAALGALQSVIAAQRLERDAVCDPDDPGRDARSAAKFLRVLPYDHERVVDDFFDRVVTRRNSRQEPRQTPVIAQIEHVKRLGVAARDRAQQVFVLLLRVLAYCNHIR